MRTDQGELSQWARMHEHQHRGERIATRPAECFLADKGRAERSAEEINRRGMARNQSVPILHGQGDNDGEEMSFPHFQERRRTVASEEQTSPYHVKEQGSHFGRSRDSKKES